MQTVVVRENLDLQVGQQVVARLRADEALTLAGELARSAFRKIAQEEGFDELLMEDGTDAQ